MPDEKVVDVESSAPEQTPEKVEEKKAPTLDDILKRVDSLAEKTERVLKQNSDKDAFINKVVHENKTFRNQLEKVSTSLEGKTEKQKDAILESHRQKFLNEGYDEKSVDLILGTIADVADRKAQERIVPVVIEAAQELVESDPEIDQEFLNKNHEEITEEYTSYKQEVSPRKIKANLKKAYKIVKERFAEKAKAAAKPDNRDDMIEGGKATPTKKKTPDTDTTIEDIERAGTVGGHFV